MKGAHLFIFMCLCVSLSLCVRHMSRAVPEAKRRRGIPWGSSAGGWELQEVGASNDIWVLWKSS